MIRITDIFRFAFSTLTEKKLRAILTIIGIAIGPAAMVTIIGTTQGYSLTIVSSLTSLGQNVIVVFPEKGYSFTDNTVNALKSLSYVKTAIPFYTSQGVIKRSDGSQLTISIYATNLSELFKVVPSLEFESGVIPSPTSYTSGILGHDIAYKDNNRLINVGDSVGIKIAISKGSNLEIKNINVRISGILGKYGNALVLNPDSTLFLPLQAGRSLFSMNNYSGILVVAIDSAHVVNVVDGIKNKYKDLVTTFAFQQIANIINSVVDTLNFLLFALSSSAFSVAITGTMATMFTSVIERSKEIGVLKAMGYSNALVLLLITTEALLMSLLGGIVGVIIGTIGANVLSSTGSFVIRGVSESITIKAGPLITTDLILRSIGMAIVVGVVGGFIPAYRASKIQPAIALKYE
ncbi:MAG: FtsX-like permease family protein [Thermoprotei archaeon]